MSGESQRSHVEIARERLLRWLGVDLRRGALARNLERHVAARIVSLRCPSPERWAALLDAEGSSERAALVDATTVPHSWLWRDAAQLEAIGRALASRPPARLRIWVPGCASGEDAYTVAALALAAGHDPRVLGTDVNTQALARASAARWSAWSARELPPGARAAFPRDGDGVRASDALRSHVALEARSLLDEPPARDWDLVLCRNVLIYFDRDLARRVVEQLAGALAPGGLLALGASDVLADLPPSVVPAGPAGRALLMRCEARVSAPPRAAAPPLASSPAPMRAPLPPTPVAPSRARLAPDETEPTLADLASVDPRRGLAAAEARIARDPADAEAQLVAGLVLHGRGAYEAAIVRLRAATCVAPGAWVGWLYLGLAGERLGRWEDARRAFACVATACGEGESLPDGHGELAETLRATRAHLVEVARRKARTPVEAWTTKGAGG